MKTLVNIFTTGTILELEFGQYNVDLLGGWKVDLGQFKFRLKNKRTGAIIKPERINWWPKQSIINGRRAKRIYKFNIVEADGYELELSNPETITVKPSNLWIISSFQRAVPSEQLELFIT